MNFFEPYDWDTMMNQHPLQDYDIAAYHNILCPPQEYPHFINKYLELPLMLRLGKIGLLCGTDWTALYRNRFFYSRLDHSIGVALITWHFTKDKAQTLASLFHDVSTPVFSHVSDFRKGDALTQTSTEEGNSSLIRNNKTLMKLLARDGLYVEQVENYHLYPIADNHIPQLSADRLEYMFPSGMALDGSWTIKEIKRCYNNIQILKNEEGIDELGFSDEAIALEYCRHFCMIGHILQLNENKLTLNLLGTIMNLACQKQILSEADFMNSGEKELIQKLDKLFISPQTAPAPCLNELASLYKTWRTMTKIKHTESPLSGHYCVNLQVKQRYINPLVKTNDGTKRLNKISEEAAKIIDDFLSFQDTSYGCVELR